jgi:hypothetical protein
VIAEPSDPMRSLAVATAIFECLTNGWDCLFDPMTAGSHPEAGCRSLPIGRTENLATLHRVFTALQRRARPMSCRTFVRRGLSLRSQR